MMDQVKGDDRYELKRKIGGGGQGTVWLAEDTIIGGDVAIKVLHSETVSDATYLRNLLLGEARLQAQLSNVARPHPNIVCIIDVRRLEDDIGIVMEYVDGGSIADYLGPRNRRTPMGVSQVVDAALATCEALAAAHAVGIIHRDIKPGNILFRKADAVVKVADWGIAKNIDIAGQGRTFTGTPPYMSEEVIFLKRKSPIEIMRSEGVDARADIYSLGVTMFEMLTGAYPFEGEEAILQGVDRRQETVLLEKGVDVGLAAVVLKAMALKKAQRYQTARELQAALQALQGSTLIKGDLDAAWELNDKKRDTAGAERKFQEIVHRYPNNALAYLELAQFYNQCSREDDAIRVLNTGAEKAPENARVWNMRGRLYAKRNSPLAVSDLQRALALGLPEGEARQVRRMLARIQGEPGIQASGGWAPPPQSGRQ